MTQFIKINEDKKVESADRASAIDDFVANSKTLLKHYNSIIEASEYFGRILNENSINSLKNNDVNAGTVLLNIVFVLNCLKHANDGLTEETNKLLSQYKMLLPSFKE